MKKAQKLLAALLAIIMVLGMLPAAVFAAAPDPNRNPGYIQIKLNLYDLDTGDPLPYVEMGINHNGTQGGYKKSIIKLKSDETGVAYVSVPYYLENGVNSTFGSTAYLYSASDGSKVQIYYHNTNLTQAQRNDQHRFDVDVLTAGYGYDVTANGKIRNVKNVMCVNSIARTTTYGAAYDDFNFTEWITWTAPEGGAWVEMDVYLQDTTTDANTVTFVTDEIGNADEFTPAIVNNGETLTIPTAYKKGSSTITATGWKCDGVDFISGETKVRHNITLTPVWPETHTVTFDTTGLDNKDNAAFIAQPVLTKEKATKPSVDPSKSGETFMFWTLVGGDGSEYNFSTPVTSDITLKPAWRQKHTVTFDTSTLDNKTDAAFGSQSVFTGEKAAAPTVTPEKGSKTFLHWALNGVKFDFENDIVTSDITLKPVFEVQGIIHFQVYMWDHEYYVSHGETGSGDHRADGQTMIPIDGVKMILKSYPGPANSENGANAPAAADWNTSWNGLIEDSRKIPVGRPGGAGTELEGVVVNYDFDTGTFSGDYIIDADQMQYLKVGYIIDTDPDSTVMGRYDRGITVDADDYPSGNGISSHSINPEYTKFGMEKTVFDWDWYAYKEDTAGAGNTGVRVVPEVKRRGGTIPNGQNLNDVVQISQDMIDNGFEVTYVCFVVPAVVVQFDSNGGAPSYPMQKFRPVNSLPADQQNFKATNPGSPELTGKVFVGWYEVLGQNDAGEDILDNTPWDFNRVVGHSMTLKAQYTDKLYSATWMDETGTITYEYDKEKYKSGDVPYYDGTLPTKAATETTEYEFIGWKLTTPAGDDHVYWVENGRKGTAIVDSDQVYIAQFKEIPIFRVVHSSDGDVVTYKVNDPQYEGGPLYSAGFDITRMVKEGYLYGGLYTDDKFTAAYDDSGDFLAVYKGNSEYNGLNIKPAAGDTYYLKEVSDQYLRLKNFLDYCETWIDPKLERIFPVTALDSTNYLSYGFIVSDSTVESGSDTVFSGTEDKNSIQLYNTCSNPGISGGKKLTVKDVFGITDGGYIGIANIFEGNVLLRTSSLVRTYTPYWVTFDGVQVFNEDYREFSAAGFNTEYNKSSSYSSYSPETKNFASANICVKYSGGVSLTSIPLHAASTYAGSETPVIVKYDNGRKYAQAANRTDMTDYVTYAGKDGYVLAGWYSDDEYTCPADFSEIGDNMEVYAKYIPEESIAVSFTKTNKGITASIAMIEEGFENISVSVNGVAAAAVENADATRLNAIIATLLGKQAVKVYTADMQGIKNGKNNITISWTTADGSEISDYTLDCTYIFGTLKFN